jgi:predicted CxxxxCH...CXXCH cytochrome family protein
MGWVGVVATAGTPTINGNPGNPTFITPGAAATCANYCHGATLPGGAHNAVTWTETSLACNSCHFIANPPAPHPGVDTLGAPITSSTQCRSCHPDTVKADGTIDLAGGKHVNGLLDGGGHPAGFSDPTVHGPVALAGIASCQACHGAAYDGNGVYAMNCNDCHASPSAHGLTGFTGSTHWKDDCTFCHGSALRGGDTAFPLVGGAPQVRENLAGPPVGPNGVTTGLKVGAHLAHFDQASNALSDPISCSECHGPTTPTDLSHVDGTVTLGWGSLATAHGSVVPTPSTITPAWEAAPTCTNYCHGATLGSTAPPPTWTGGPLGCTGCHGYPPSSGEHDLHYYQLGWSCADCHAGTVTYPTAGAPSGTIIGNHVNGLSEVQFHAPGSSWSGSTCTSACHPTSDNYPW